MPELPEVETILRDLSKRTVDRKINEVFVQDPTVLTGHLREGRTSRTISVSRFEKSMRGKGISKFHRRGKYLIMDFSDQTSLIFHLRMTGQLLVSPPNGKERLTLTLDDGTTLCFRDTRRFGEIVFSRDWQNEKTIRSLGLEPLHDKLSASLLQNLFRNRRASIHSLLLNQKIICGLGNIYATEALFLSRILPSKPAGTVSREKCENLASSIRKILKASIRNRGYSMSTYVDALGRKGRSQLYSAAYGKKGKPCISCGSPLRKEVLAGRGVVYCGRCQN